MLGRATDIQKTVVYNSGRVGGWFLRRGAVALIACAVLIPLQPDDFGAGQWTMVAAGIVAGGACALYGFSRWKSPQPMVTLSPAGLRLHMEFVKTVLIPWKEVHGVDSIDIGGTVGGEPKFLSGVTVVLVGRAFYDRYIHVNSWLLRGPAWHMNFVPKGDQMQVALHHEMLQTTAAELRAAVESRWRGFGPPSQRTSLAATKVT